MSEELARLVQGQVTGMDPLGIGDVQATRGHLMATDCRDLDWLTYRLGVYDGALAAFRMAATSLDRYRPEADPDEAVEVAAEGLWRHMTVRDVSTWADAPDASKVSMRRQAATVLAALSERYEITPKGAARCICSGDRTGEDIDERPDCRAHGVSRG